MAVFCSRYLTSDPFKHGLRERSVREFALSGYYSLQDYAAAFWHHHVDFVLNPAANVPVELSENIVGSVICLLGDYKVMQQTGSTTLGSQPGPTAEQIRKILQEWRNNGQKDSFEERTSAIRRVIELIDIAGLDDQRKTVFLGLNGVPHFKCPKPRCQMFALGFMDRQTRDAHVEEHERPFKCPNEGCYARSIGFPSQSALDVHDKRLHSYSASPQPLFPPSTMKTDIFTACTRGDLDAVKVFVSQGIDVNVATQPRGQLTPLVLAARKGHVLVCQYLILRGARIYHINASIPRGSITALGEAIKRQDYDLFRILVETADEHQRLTFLGGSPTRGLQHYVQAAVVSGAVEILRDLLSWYKQSSDAAVDTILYDSCEWKNNEAIARILLSRMKPEDINRLNNVGETPLREAVRFGNVNIVRLLLEAGADAHIKDKEGRLPVYWACANYNAKIHNILTILLDYTDDLDCPDNPGETLLQAAMRYNRTEAVRLLVEKGADVNAKGTGGWAALHMAVKRGDEAAVRLLVELGADINATDASGWTVLYIAVKRGDKAVARLLVELGADVNAKVIGGQTALHLATEQGDEAAARLLVEKGADVNIKDVGGRTALRLATERGYEAVAKLLVEEGADTNAKDAEGWMALHLAVKRGDEAEAGLLVERGADINARDASGWTVLHLAVKRRDEAAVRLLVELGAYINARDAGGGTVLHLAAEQGDEAVARLLVEKGADVNARNAGGRTVLHLAVEQGAEAAARLLVEKGADVNARDAGGWTVLHLAADQGDEAVARLLVEKGVDVNAEEKFGLTALQLAEERRRKAVIQILRSC
jgi:ankyrin repeat protein